MTISASGVKNKGKMFKDMKLYLDFKFKINNYTCTSNLTVGALPKSHKGIP